MRNKLYYKNRIKILQDRDRSRNETFNMRIINALKREYKKKFEEPFEL